MDRRALVVHATNLLVRGFQAESPDRRSGDGRPTNALFALTRALRRALAFKLPDRAVAVLDASPDESAWPPLLPPQHAALAALLEVHGLRVVASDEPHHLVASYVEAALAGGHDVVVVGSDKRLAQLVGDEVWWYDAYKDVRYTPELVRKRFEVLPPVVAGWLALVGDDDALPGVKGIGKKGATTLIETVGSVEEALARADEVEGRTGKLLRASLEAAGRELGRATLDRARPLPVAWEELPFAVPDPEALNALYHELGFFSLLHATDEAEPARVTVCDTPEAAEQALARLGDAPVALHPLIEDPSPPRGALAGLALARADGEALYFPFGGRGRVLDGPEVLADWLENAAIPKVGHDLKAATVALARRGVTLRGVVGDSGCASHLAEPSGMAPHDLHLVAKRRLRRALTPEDDVRGVGRARKAWSALPVGKAGAFAAEMAQAAAALWSHFEPGVPRALLDEHLALAETLARMELAGIACDGNDLTRAGEDFTVMRAGLEEEIYGLAGKTFNLGSTKQLGTVLFEELGLTIISRTKTGWSTATPALERIEHEHPIVPLVVRWRLLRWLEDSWVTALRASIDEDGRVRSTFHGARSFSGRVINAAPDLGRVPGRTPEMARIRHAFAAPPGKTLLSVDYKQLGLYVLAHLTRDPALVEPLAANADMHVLTASAVLERPVEQIGPAERQTGKVVNFATFAGQGASALALQLGVGAQDARQLIERFDRRYAVVRVFQDEQLRLARERGYIETLAGRRWPIGDLSSLDPQIRSYAERLARRATHEGSVADVTRRGLLRADEAVRAAGLGAFPVLQVLDEVLFEVTEAELEATCRVAGDALRGAFELHVPLRVTCKAGPSWAELTPVALPASSA